MDIKFRGLTFPFIITDGKVTTGGLEECIISSIKNILSYLVGTRWFNYDFGAFPHKLMKEPNDTIQQALIEKFLMDGIHSYEPRVTLQPPLIISNDGLGKFSITITYEIKSTKELNELVYTFYGNN